MYDITVIGGAILDILARPVSGQEPTGHSCSAEGISMAVGGDAANEATILARLGKKVNLITKFGNDIAGRLLQSHFQENGVSIADSIVEDGLDTGINIVLVDKDAERSFITNKNGSLRRLALLDVSLEALKKSPVVSFASFFVSPLFDVPAMTSLFRAVKENGGILCADTTRPKNGETLEELRPALGLIDYFFPNYAEAQAITGKNAPEEIAQAFLDCGVSCVVIKLGREGCFLNTAQEAFLIPAYPHARCIDTTGAGDNFAAGFLYALSEGMAPVECARFGNAAASVTVESVGACTGLRSLDQVLERYRRMPPAVRQSPERCPADRP